MVPLEVLSQARIDAAVKNISHRLNRYGFIHYDDVPNIIIGLDTRLFILFYRHHVPIRGLDYMMRMEEL